MAFLSSVLRVLLPSSIAPNARSEASLCVCMELVAPLSFPMSGGRAVLMALTGVVSVVFGVLIAAQPASGLLAVAWLIGVYAIVFGVMYIVVYFESRSLASSLA